MPRVLALLVMPNLAAPALAEKPWTDQGFAGLAMRDVTTASNDSFTIASWILPGPLDGRGLESPSLCRPDLIVAVNGQPIDAEGFRRLQEQAAPGDRMVIEYRRSRQRGGTIPAAIDHEDTIERVEISLGSREQWSGTIGRPRGHDAVFDPGPNRLLRLDKEDSLLVQAVVEHDLKEPIDRLLKVFPAWLDRHQDFHGLSRFEAGFRDPLALPEVATAIAESTRAAVDDPVGAAAAMIAANLDLPDGLLPFDPEHQCPHPAAAMMEHLAQVDRELRAFLGDLHGDEAFARQCLNLLRVPRESFYITGPETSQHLAVIRSSMRLNWSALARATVAMRYLALIEPHDYSRHRPMELPPELAGAVEGPIISALPVHEIGWVVIGSVQDNRYDMSRIAGVIEPGGNDAYWCSGLMMGSHAIIDLGGDDHYEGRDDQGQGSALLGASFIDDRAGNDRYEGKLLSTGAAMFGLAILLDRGGNDHYDGGEWSQGAAMYGAGVIIDLGDGGDSYRGEFLCQGVGGPRGFGAIIDQGGRDLYRANGPTPSAYGTAAIHLAYSQGIGFGFRHYAAGGIGIISDLDGDDRYEAGEFAQGGGYYRGLGILHDVAGRDLYYGNRYGQGFGVHQALGALIDESGDDTYWSMTAASQGSGWDIGAGLLLDRAGNDSYQCDDLGQGAAAMQAIGLLIDLGGTDRYSAAPGSVQGQSGGNSYHYPQTGAMSLSLLLDLGGCADWYSSGRGNGQTVATGSPNAQQPDASTLHGLCIDR